MAWSKNGTPSTLTVAGDVITISDVSAKKFNVVLNHIIGSTTVDIDQTFNNDSNAVYAIRKSADGAADATATGDTKIDKNTTATTVFDINYCCSLTAEEKIGIGFLVNQSTAGVGTAPSRLEYVYKFVPSPDADISRVDASNTGTTNEYSIGSNLSILGSD